MPSNLTIEDVVVETWEGGYKYLSQYPDYYGLVASLGYDIEHSECFGSYQGDYAFILQNGDKIGLLILGYGSCSVCDTLQSLVDHNREDWSTLLTELTELANGYEQSIRWFDNADDLIRSFNKDEQEEIGNWWWYDEEITDWVKKVLGYDTTGEAGEEEQE